MNLAVLRLQYILRARAREHGFGMIELLAAMTILLVGVLALFAVFEAGMTQIRRASKVTTAQAIADAEIERYRAVRFDSIGLAATDLAGVDGTYTGDGAYLANAPSTTLTAAMTSSQLTMSVASATGFPTGAPYIVKVDTEFILVSGGAGTTSWTIVDSAGASESLGRGYLGSTAAAHSSGATVQLIRLVDVPKCGTAPCTDSLPSKTVTGADGGAYRVDTYVTWRQTFSSGSTGGRLLKLVTVVIRDSTSPYRVWARLGSSFDESTGV